MAGIGRIFEFHDEYNSEISEIVLIDLFEIKIMKITIYLFKTLILLSVPHFTIITNIEWLLGF